MGDVVISPNLKKKAVRIDAQGNTFDPKTKEVIPAEPEYVPPTPATPPAQPVPEAPKPSGIQSKIEAKIEEIINRKIEEALNKLL